MEFLRNVFTNFIFEKFSHEALVTGRVTGQLLATTCINNETPL